MANTTSTLLTDVANILRDRYFDDKWHEGTRPRTGMPQYMNWKSLDIKGNTATFQVKTRPYTGARVSAMEAALGTPKTIDGKKVVVNLGKTSSDIKRITAGIQYTKETEDFTDYDGLVSKITDELAMGAMDDMTEHLGQLPWLGAKGLMFTMDGVAYDAVDGGALANGDVNFMFAVTGGSPTLAIPGLEIDFYSGATKKFGLSGDTVATVMIVTNVKYLSQTFGSAAGGKWYIYAKCKAGTAVTTAATMDSLTIYRSGEYDQAVLSFNDWFNVAADGGTDTIFHDDTGTALDRTDPSIAAFWLPTTHAAHSSLSNFALEDLDTVWTIIRREMGDKGAPSGLVMTGDPEMWQNIKRLMEFNKRTIIPMDQETRAIFGIDGMSEHYFIDPVIGKIALTADQYSPANLIQILNANEWGWLKSGPPEFLPGGVGGIWENVGDTTTRYAAWRADLYMLTQTLCFGPRLGNYRITNVRSTNT